MGALGLVPLPAREPTQSWGADLWREAPGPEEEAEEAAHKHGEHRQDEQPVAPANIPASCQHGAQRHGEPVLQAFCPAPVHALGSKGGYAPKALILHRMRCGLSAHRLPGSNLVAVVEAMHAAGHCGGSYNPITSCIIWLHCGLGPVN